MSSAKLLYTEGETLDEIKQAVADAVRCHFDEDDMPKVIRLEMSKQELIHKLWED